MPEKMMDGTIQFTDNALKEIKKVLDENKNKNLHLRIGVKGGGCSGLSYILGLDQQNDEDMEYQIQGVPVIMNVAHGLYLMGMRIDYGNGLEARGFIFENPNASSTCGCGTSFSV